MPYPQARAMTDPKDLPDNFYLAAAVGVQSFDDILKMYDIPEEAADDLTAHPVFQQRLLLAKDAVETDGTAFFARCRLLAGQTMPNMVDLIQDASTPATVQLEAWRTLVKYGRLEPQPKEQAAGASGPQLTLTIIAPNGDTAFSTSLVANQPRPDPVPVLAHYDAEDDDWVDPPDLLIETRATAASLGFAP